MPTNNFDIAIVGMGAAGLHLALALADAPHFSKSKVLLLDKDPKEQNDRTWCFWEKGDGNWDKLLHRQWAHGDFFFRDVHTQLDLQPYRYKMLRGLDFYHFAKQKLLANSRFDWQQAEVLGVEEDSPMHLTTTAGSFSANLVFDSRIPTDFTDGKGNSTRILQSFKGWFVRTPDDQFDPDRFTMMDYRVLWGDSSSFTYVLPFSKREALVEFTLFAPMLISDGDFDKMLGQYFDKVLKISDFEVIETERGVIPMSDFPFEKYATQNHIRIGTAGGWVKPSSGYAFKNCERFAKRIVQNMAAGKPPTLGIISKKYRWLDAIFLDVLNRRNDLGPSLFNIMYSKNPVQRIFSFLDEETSLSEELRIMIGFPQLLFLRSVLNQFLK